MWMPLLARVIGSDHFVLFCCLHFILFCNLYSSILWRNKILKSSFMQQSNLHGWLEKTIIKFCFMRSIDGKVWHSEKDHRIYLLHGLFNMYQPCNYMYCWYNGEIIMMGPKSSRDYLCSSTVSHLIALARISLGSHATTFQRPRRLIPEIERITGTIIGCRGVDWRCLAALAEAVYSSCLAPRASRLAKSGFSASSKDLW